MPTIYRKTAERITIADAKRLIVESVDPIESVSVFRNDEGKLTVTPSIFKTMHAAFIHEEFPALLRQLTVETRNMFRPSLTDYPGGNEQDGFYSIAHNGFSSIAELYGVIVQVGSPPQVPVPLAETKEQRQNRRLEACIDAGLSFKDYKGRLPDGVGNAADREGVTRQAFSTDVKAALGRQENAKREGVTVHRA